MTTTIGILGAGISGLSAAFHLSRRLIHHPNVRIVVLERSKRLGGWIKSENITVHADGKPHSLVLEAGPRSLRPKSLEMLELVHLLGLEPSLKLTTQSHPAASNRFVYFPETGLTCLPSDIFSLISSWFVDRTSLGGLLPSILAEPFRGANRSPKASDESFDSFLSRRFGAEFARRFGSSLVHGIYAADSRKLSIRAAFGPAWDAETEGGGSVLRGLLFGSTKKETATADDFELGRMQDIMKDVNVYTFQNGMESVIRALGLALQADPRINILTREDVQYIRPSDNSTGITIGTPSGSFDFSQVIASLPLPTLSNVLPTSRQPPHLHYNPSQTVHVVNIVFPPSSTPIYPPGFGYLVPRPKEDYASSTSPILGCVFDSAISSRTGPTVVTVMLGGPFPLSPEPLPIEQVLSMLAVHLGHESLPYPLLYRYHVQSNCIPTPHVGHLDRIAELKDVLRRDWEGQLRVVGSGVGGVSLGDCVKDGRTAALDVVGALRRA